MAETVKLVKSTHSPQQNHLLAALPAEMFERISPDLKLVAMPLGEVLYESGGTLHHIYFPVTAIVSLHYVMENGSSAEIAGVGNEGVVGISIFMGGEHHSQPGHSSNCRIRLPAEGAGHDGRIQPRRAYAAPDVALHAGIDYPYVTNSRMQPAPFGGTR